MKKNAVIMFIVILAGLFLRLIFINKPDGLWNDEYVSWLVASAPFGRDFWNAIKSQCHMPVYYLYLKSAMTLFGNSDLILRLTSVFTGVLSIPVMFLVGKEKDKNTGYICAGFVAISSFLIYYSQEVRLYSLLFLISALSLLYTIRLVKNPNKKNIVFYCIFNILIILTHTIGFVFVFFNLVFISLILFDKYKNYIITTWSIVLAGTTLSSGLIIKIISTPSVSQWWNHFSLSQIGFLFTDYFSPVLTNLTSAPDNFFYMPKLLFFMLVPAILATICISKSLFDNKINQGLFMTALGTVLVMVIASVSGKLVITTKYSIEIYPILIYLACSCQFNKKYTKAIIVITYSLISLGYIIIHPYSAPKMHRAEGHKIVTDILKNMDIKDGDYILIEYYNKDRFEKYTDFSKYNVISINKGNFNEYMTSNTNYSDAYFNGKALYKNLFLSDNNPCLGNKLKENIFDHLNVGQSVVMITLNSVSFYTPDDVKRIAKDDNLYRSTPLLFLVFSYLKKETFYNMAERLVPQRIEKKGNWTLVKFTKLNNQYSN